MSAVVTTQAPAAAPKPSRARGLAALGAYMRPYRKRLLEGAALLVLTNLLTQSVPKLLAYSVDALKAGELAAMKRYAVILLLCAALMAVARVLSRTRVFYVGRDIEHDLRHDLLAHLHRLGPAFFARMSTGETMSRAISDLAQVRAMIGFGSLNLVNSLIAYTLSIGLMLSLSPELTAYALMPYPLLILVTRSVGKAMYTRSMASQNAVGELSSVVQEILSSLRIVRAYNNEGAQGERFAIANNNALERNMALVTLRGLMWPLLMGITSIGTLVVLWRGTSMVDTGDLSVGELVAFLAYGELLRWPTLGLGYILAVIQRGRASLARIDEILLTEPDVVELPGAKPAGQAGALRVSNLSYRYGDRVVLDGVSFEVPAGGSLAVIGRTGSGKSTLASLLPRLLQTPTGTVFLDGDDVTELQLHSLRKTVAYAQQEPFLFSDTVARNIGYALDDPYSDAAMARIREAAREACVLSEIEELRDGFQTVVGERGVQLSGGQKQRIALARALLNEPRVLVMDDPLSAVDAKTESAILEALERAGADKTLIVITNRVAAARRADAILVLDGGRAVELGTHDELVQTGGLYASLAQRQQLEETLTSL